MPTGADVSAEGCELSHAEVLVELEWAEDLLTSLPKPLRQDLPAD
jgi:hypothetical protein